MKAKHPENFSVALVTYENKGTVTEYIPRDAWGAVGWVAVNAIREDEVNNILIAGFDYLNLKLINISNIDVISTPEEIEDLDDHLAENIRNWETGKSWVIGTVHGYIGEGTA